MKDAETNGIKSVSSEKFRRIFTEEFNTSFKGPKSDTCAKCDEFAVNIKAAKDSEDNEALKIHEDNKDLHLMKAEAAHGSLNKAIEEAKENSKTHVQYHLQRLPQVHASIRRNCCVTI